MFEMPPSLDAINLFVSAARLGSISQAAIALGTTTATASRHLSALEEALGYRLLNRSTRGLTLTAEGQSLFEASAFQLDSMNAAISELASDHARIEGPLRVLVPANFAAGPLQAFWGEFTRAHPGIALTILSNNAFDDLSQQRADLAIRIGPQPDSALVQKRLGYVGSRVVCARNYPNLPDEPQSLAEHPSIGLVVLEHWVLTKQKEQVRYQGPHQYFCNDVDLAAILTAHGAGLALLPDSVIWQRVKNGELIDTFSGWAGPAREIYLVRLDRRQPSARVRAFSEALEAYLTAQPWFNAN